MLRNHLKRALILKNQTSLKEEARSDKGGGKPPRGREIIVGFVEIVRRCSSFVIQI